MDTFPTYPAILLQVVGFFVLFGLLKTFFFGPIGNVLDERARLVKGRLEETETNRQKMVSARDEYEKRLALVEAETREKIQEAMREAQKAREEYLEKAREDATSLRDKSQRELESESAKAEKILHDKVVDLAIMAAGRIIEKNLDVEGHRKLVEDLLAEIKA